MKTIYNSILFIFLFGNLIYSQETLPVYSDYLSDNVYLLHPSAAGIGNCGKIRLTARKQWFDVDNAPSLQTLSFHTKFTEKAALGIILFNDKNGYHSQKGIQGTYAYHLNLSDRGYFHQLSFGMSLSLVLNQVDQTQFSGDPTVAQLIESRGYYNGDVSMAYHNGGLFSYATVKNLFLSARNNYNDQFESLNLRKYLFTFGYYFGEEKRIQWEPSVTGQWKERIGDKFLDFNLKAYKTVNNSRIWVVLSYRRGFGGSSSINELNYITPIIGVNYKKYLFSYTYTHQLGDISFSSGGFHQITLGINVFCEPPRASACPNINAMF